VGPLSSLSMGPSIPSVAGWLTLCAPVTRYHISRRSISHDCSRLTGPCNTLPTNDRASWLVRCALNLATAFRVACRSETCGIVLHGGIPSIPRLSASLNTATHSLMSRPCSRHSLLSTVNCGQRFCYQGVVGRVISSCGESCGRHDSSRSFFKEKAQGDQGDRRTDHVIYQEGDEACSGSSVVLVQHILIVDLPFRLPTHTSFCFIYPSVEAVCTQCTELF
jgi:hypothetical protein